ncbi:TPA: DUF2977 domain-containing protein, partial [Staphylococcus aureus]|nr:DUF2977 domain-containing protein [Staphylococcus aureus]
MKITVNDKNEVIGYV